MVEERQQPASTERSRLLQLGWLLLAVCLVALGYFRYFSSTYFTQDSFVWLCFGKFYEAPLLDVFLKDTQSGQFYRPIPQLWWYVIHAFFGDRLHAYQAAFLAVHLGNSLFAALLASRLCRPGVAPLVWLLFALNPLFVAPCSSHLHYIFDTLGFTFFVLSLWTLIYGVQQARWTPSLLSLVLALAAYASKEAFFTLPGVVVLVLGVERAGQAWSFAALRRRLGWFVAHVLAWTAAMAFRWMLLGGIGGYALAETENPGSLGMHLLDRARTFVQLAGSAIIPHLQFGGVLLISGLVVGLLTALLVWRRQFPGAVWVWCWMILTWSPSALMTTHAAISWYACSFGTALLVALVLRSLSRAGAVAALGVGLVYSFFAVSYYRQVQPNVAELKSQHAVLQTVFPDGGRALPRGSKVFLLRSNPDLFPDAVVKYTTDSHDTFAEVLFVNPLTPVDWIITGLGGPGEIAPLRISPYYQDGYMDMGSWRVYALDYEVSAEEILRTATDFRFWAWQPDGSLADITKENPFRDRAGAAPTLPRP